MDNLERVRSGWEAAWPRALLAWSKFTRLREPLLCATDEEAAREGLKGSFAMIRLQDQAVVISLEGVMRFQLEGFAIEVLAHEIGHHILAPVNLTDHARSIARIRKGLPTLEAQAPWVANLYTDLLINDRLQRSAQLCLDEVFKRLRDPARTNVALWWVYMRIYEILWSLPTGTLTVGRGDDQRECDARLGARLIRSYARDWVEGSGRFAALLLPYLVDEIQSAEAATRGWADTRHAAAGGQVSGLAEVEGGERLESMDPGWEGDSQEGRGTRSARAR